MSQESCQKFIDTYKLLLSSDRTLKEIYELGTTLHLRDKACIYFDEDGKKQSYDYRDYRNRVSYIAKHLSKALSGIPAGATVALKIRNCPTWPILFWALLMNGHPALLIDAKLAHENTENLLRQAEAKAILVNEEESYAVPMFRINEIKNAEDDEAFAPRWADEVLFCSSGTTGDIKIMVMNGEALSYQIAAAADLPLETTHLMHEGKINILAMIPFHHIFGFAAVFLWYTFYGKTIVYPTSLSSHDIVNAIQKGPATHIYSVPLFWDGIAQTILRSAGMKSEREKELLRKMIAYNNHTIAKKEAGWAASAFIRNLFKKRVLGTQVEYCISGGGYLMPKTCAVINGAGYPLYNGFGMTEIGITSVELSPRVEDRLKCSIGHPFHGLKYKIVPTERSAQGEGELFVSTPTIHSEEIIGGIRKKTELAEGWYATGDIASKDRFGNYYLKGRIKDTIIGSNGENIYPDEIETYFKDVDHVVNAVVLGLPKDGQEKIVLVVELDNAIEDNDLKTIKDEIDKINATLPDEKRIGEALIYKKAMPLANNMKVKRFVLRDEILKDSPDFMDFGGERQTLSFDGFDPSEVKSTSDDVRKIFSKTLLLPEFKIPDEGIWTTDLGGDSMSYVSMVNDLNEAFHLTIPLEKYGKLTCVRDFTHEILTLKREEDKKSHKKQK
jgi:long-chain acyl-CoA synthetase